MVLILLTAFPVSGKPRRRSDRQAITFRASFDYIVKRTESNHGASECRRERRRTAVLAQLPVAGRMASVEPTQHTNGIIAENIQYRTLIDCRWVLSPTPFRAV